MAALLTGSGAELSGVAVAESPMLLETELEWEMSVFVTYIVLWIVAMISGGWLVEVEISVVFSPFHCGEEVEVGIIVEAAKHPVPKPDSLVQ